MSATTYTDVSELSFDFSARHGSPDCYPSPANTSSDSSEQNEEAMGASQPTKKKRKAWGQPVPEIVPILPPRKRAKTAEEKEQRKNERILRNRRAADKSRQRQKAAQADLESTNQHLAAENAYLKQLLEQNGITSDFSFTPSTSTPAPMTSATPSIRHPSICNDDTYDQPDFSTPVLVPDSLPTPQLSLDTVSPTLAPSLSLDATISPVVASSSLDNGLTQYPAVVLCDLQCQPVLKNKLAAMAPSSMVSTLLTLIHYLTISSTSTAYSTSTSLSALFRILEATFTATSPQLASLILENFSLIHILISMPSTATQPAVFRMKVLSRLIACNPCIAPLLTTAADRALEQKLADEGASSHWTADPERRWAVASLMTIKWSIKWLQRQHESIRVQIRNGQREQIDRNGLGSKGVDLNGVEQYCNLFDRVDPLPRVMVAAC